MKEKELRRSMAIFPIGSVMKLTDLTARQIRYYEDHGLVHPERTDGNRRLYSLNDMDKLLEIKDFLTAGMSMSAIKKHYQEGASQLTKNTISEEEIRRIFHDEFRSQSGFDRPDTGFGNRPF